MNKSLVAIFAGLLLQNVSFAADVARTGKNDALRVKPFTNAAITTPLARGTTVEIQKREGTWYFVKFGQKTGWVPMLSVQRTTPVKTTSAGSLSTVASGRSAGGGIVSTTGVRGLNEEELTKASFSDSAVSAAEFYRVSAAQAALFAKEAGIVPQKVNPLSDPAKQGGK